MKKATPKPPLVIDLAGKRFGRWLVLRLDPYSRGRRGGPRWICRCECGKQCSVIGAALRHNHSTQCQKCAVPNRARRLVYQPGDKVGEWTIIEYIAKVRRYRCRCSCGRISLNIVGNLRRGGDTQRCQECAAATPQKRRLVYQPGDKVGEWTIIDYFKDRRYQCRCSCGRIALQFVGNLRVGNTRRCQECARTKP